MPLVLNFHGFGRSASIQESYSGMAAKADAAGFITVAPDGTGNPAQWFVPAGTSGNTDQVAFVRDLIRGLSTNLNIDPNRIYAAGISSGGGMVLLLGCNLGDVIAAVAPVAAVYGGGCQSSRHAAVVAFHGTADPNAPFEGGPTYTSTLSGERTPTGGRMNDVRASLKVWAQSGGGSGDVVSERIAPDVMLEKISTDVWLYVIEGGGHTWPGGAQDAPASLGRTARSIKATDLLWEFFRTHPRR
jgi:polyhydroxybutyrate depolymerase